MNSVENQTNAGEVHNWPQWILSAGADVPASLEQLDATSARFRIANKTDYRYRHVAQAPLNAEMDRLVADGVIDPKGKKKPLGTAQLQRSTAIGMIYHNASAYRLLGQLAVAKQMVLVHLIDAARSNASTCNLIGVLTCFRNVIEHVAHFHALIQKVQGYPTPMSIDEANRAIWEINSKVVASAYGTRTDWKKLLTGDAEELLRKDPVEYVAETNRQDRKASSIMTAIDQLTKKIKGTRAVYEMLCEFAHPNVGTIFGLTKSQEAYEDEQGVLWETKEITLGEPLAAVREMGDVFNTALKILGEVVVHFEKLLSEAELERKRVQQISQIVLRQALANNRDLISPYAPCPCDSGKKAKFCCGQSKQRPNAGMMS